MNFNFSTNFAALDPFSSQYDVLEKEFSKSTRTSAMEVDDYSSDSEEDSDYYSEGEWSDCSKENDSNSCNVSPIKSQMSPLKSSGLDQTPIKIKQVERKLQNREFDFDTSLSPYSKQQLESGFKSFSEMGPAKKRQVARRLAFETLEAMDSDSPISPFSTSLHRKVSTIAKESDWLVHCLLKPAYEQCKTACPEVIEELPKTFINLDHIVKPDFDEEGKKAKGFHFVPLKKRDRVIIHDRIVNPYNGVFCGFYQASSSGDIKFSSFFPESIHSKKDLISVINSAKEIAIKDNRQLLQSSNLFKIEAYIREGGFLVQSAFPIFFDTIWDSSSASDIPGIGVISPLELFNLAKTSLEDYKERKLIKGHAVKQIINPIRFVETDEEGREYYWMDLAPVLRQTHKSPVEQGILIKFPKEVFMEDFGKILDTLEGLSP